MPGKLGEPEKRQILVFRVPRLFRVIRVFRVFRVPRVFRIVLRNQEGVVAIDLR